MPEAAQNPRAQQAAQEEAESAPNSGTDQVPPSDNHHQSDADELPDYQSDVEETNAQDPAPSSSSPPPTEREAQWQVALSEADVFLNLMSDLLDAPAQPAAEEESDDSDSDGDEDEAAADDDGSGSEQESLAHGSETETEIEAELETGPGPESGSESEPPADSQG